MTNRSQEIGERPPYTMYVYMRHFFFGLVYDSARSKVLDLTLYSSYIPVYGMIKKLVAYSKMKCTSVCVCVCVCVCVRVRVRACVCARSL